MGTLVAWIILGLVAGGLAKLIIPGKEPGGLWVQLGLGIGGAFFGGFLNRFLKILPAVHTEGLLPGIGDILTATFGAMMLIVGYRLFQEMRNSSGGPE
ncbi:MAG: GlsB/YeaQ/YmgE family stress response membrane protein [Verrucomicrobiota bacterium]